MLGDPVNFVDPNGEMWGFVAAFVVAAIIIKKVYDVFAPAYKKVEKDNIYNKNVKVNKYLSNGDYDKAEKLQDEIQELSCKALNGGYVTKAMNGAISLPGTFTGGPLPITLTDVAAFEINSKINSGIYGNNYPLNVKK